MSWKKREKKYNNRTPAWSKRPATSQTHLPKSIFIKNDCESVNTWVSNERLSGHGSTCHSVKQRHPDLIDPGKRLMQFQQFWFKIAKLSCGGCRRMNIKTILRIHYIHRLRQQHFKSPQCSISHLFVLNQRYKPSNGYSFFNNKVTHL